MRIPGQTVVWKVFVHPDARALPVPTVGIATQLDPVTAAEVDRLVLAVFADLACLISEAAAVPRTGLVGRWLFEGVSAPGQEQQQGKKTQWTKHYLTP